MQSNNSFISALAKARARLAVLAATFVAASIGYVAPAWADLTGVTVSAQTGALTTGTAGTATYTVTVSRNLSLPLTSSVAISGLPTGATAVVGTPSAWNPLVLNGSQTFPLTINTTAAPNAGAFTFTATATGLLSTTRTASGTLTIGKRAPTVTFNTAPTPAYLGGNFTVSATTNSGGALSYAYVSGNCTLVNGNTGSFSSTGPGPGTCTVQANAATTTNFLAGSAQQVVTIAKAAQTITFAALANKTFGDADFTVSATASSNLAVTFAATGSCTIATNTVHITGPGSCTVTASQAGNPTYNAATAVARTFTIAPATQTITFAALANKTFGDADFTVSATASSGLAVSFTASGSCTIAASTVHITGAGSCTVTAAQAGNANYVAATAVARSFTIAPASQTITFGALAGKTFGDADFAVSATASSGLAVSFTASGSCTIAVNTVHITGAGSCTVTAAQAGNANISAATAVPRTFTIAPASQTITFGALASKTFGDADFAVSATASSGLAVSFTSSGSCTVAANTVHLTGVGSCTVTAAQPGNANYSAAAAVAQTFTINKLSQTIAFNAPPAHLAGDIFTAGATASSGLPVTLAATGDCSVAGNKVTVGTPASFPGSCSLTASQAGDANTLAATPVSQSFAINAFGGINLYAVAGTTTLPGQTASVPVWGYSTTNAAVTAPGGSPIDVKQGATVTIRLFNTLPVPTSLLLQGQGLPADLTGVAAGESKVYTFTASQPGTYLYEAGLLAGSQTQVAMGLHGALVVRPAVATQAYADIATTTADEGALTAFNDEAVLVLSEIDPALNNSANPAGFDMRDFAPQYFTINGKVFPKTDPIPSTAGSSAAAGSKVLLRYVNAGVKHHSMAVLGLRQNFVAKDGALLPTLTHDVAAETLAPGQTGDAIVTIPATVAQPTRFAVYDSSLLLRNSNEAGFGGMLTFVNAGTGAATAGGPSTSAVTLTTDATTGDVTVSATLGAGATSAEYFIDSTTGTGTDINTPISATTLAGLSSGKHTVYVHATNGTTYGGFASATLNLDTTGPAITGLSLTPNPSNGTVALALHASADDTAAGGSNIAAAEYFIGTPGANGTGIALTLSTTASPTVSVDTAAAIAAGTSGVISVHAQDAAGNWGPFKTITPTIVTTGPATTLVSASPSPNNGATPFNSSVPAVRVTASVAAATGATVTLAEGFIDTVGANGTGFQFVAADGAWNGATEAAYGDIPLATVALLADGTHTIYVHGKDNAGNWGPTTSTTLVIDKTAPTVSSIALVGTSPTNATTVQYLVTFSESVTGGAASNFTLVAGAGLTGASITSVSGTGATRTVTVSTGSGAGTIGLNLTSATGVADSAGNAVAALPVSGPVVTIDKTAPTVSSINRVGTATTTNTATVQFLVTFSESVTGGAASDFTLATTGTVSGASVASVSGAGTTRTVTVNTGTGDGTIGLNLGPTAGIIDVAGNAVASTLVGQTFTIDKTPPALTATVSATSVTFGTAVTVTVTASDASGIALRQYWIDGTPNLPANPNVFTGTSFIVNLSPSVHAIYVRAQDGAGNGTVVSAIVVVSGGAVNDALPAITSSTTTPQTFDATSAANSVLNNDQAGTGRTAALLTAPVRTAGTGNGTIALSCPTALGTAGVTVGGSAICTNGAYRVTLTGSQAAKRGTYTFTYNEVLNGATSTATVTIQVN